MNRRVVVTGMGAVTPLGNDVNTFWDNLKTGVNGIKKIDKFDTSEIGVNFAASVNFEPKYLDRKEKKRLEAFCQYAVEASCEAIENAGIDMEKEDPTRIGVIAGSGIGSIESFDTNIMNYHEKGPNKIGILFIPQTIINMAPGAVAIRHGAKGTCYSVVTACATGTTAIGEAFRSIKHGYQDVIIAGGTEAAINPMAIAGFNNMKALSRATELDRASIPFDDERSGFVMGEGAGMLILEELDRAIERGATIYGEIVGYGSTCDAFHMTSPDPEGTGAYNAMNQAINEAKIDKTEIGYINAHGTSTELNDKTESKAIVDLFGEHANDLMVSSTKSMTGHLLGAAGAIEGIAVIKALEEGILPRTLNHKVKDENCTLNYIPEGAEKDVKYALSNSLGFGGHNAVICFKKWEGQ